ncbi:Protein SABRE [Linum grandiflorum]
MAASLVNYFYGFLFVCATLLFLFLFASRLVALILGCVVGASLRFRVGGWKSLRDIVVKLKKGPVESVSVGEIRVGLRQPLAKLSVGSKDPKLQLLICDLEIVLRPSSKGSVSKKRRSRSGRSQKTPGKGKWMVLANVAKFLSVSLTNLVVKVCDDQHSCILFILGIWMVCLGKLLFSI